MATPFDRLMDTIRPHVPGAVDVAIKQEMYMAFREFFEKSNTWRELIAFTVRAGFTTEDITPTAGRMQTLMGVVNSDGYPVRGATLSSDGTITLRSAPSTDADYIADVSIVVTDPVDRNSFPIVPYDLVDKYMDELVHGVLARMQVQPSKPYTNITLAQYHQMKFNSMAARARNEKNTGNTYGSQRWSFPQSFRNT